MATGHPPFVGAIAVSDDLAARIPPGTVVRIRGTRYRALDRMDARWYHRVDIFFATPREALRWGVRKVRMEVQCDDIAGCAGRQSLIWP